jgi:hypothetical protein
VVISPAMPTHAGPSRRAAAAFATTLSMLGLASGCAGRPRGGLHDGSHGTGAVDTGATFHGWGALVLRNAHQRVTIVPAIGRVMGLDFAPDEPSAAPAPAARALDPFWSHPQLGPQLAPDHDGWINYGGDKAWPAPQSDWMRVAGRGWPPPPTFDARPYAISIDRSEVEMLSAIDPAFGIRVRRRIALSDDRMLITTTYEKLQGPPVRVAVWTITQLQPPDRMFVLLPKRSTFAGGYRSRLPAPPRDLTADGRLLSLARDPAQKTMIVSDGDALLWIGEARSLLIENVSDRAAPRPGETPSWPDGAHAQIYTSPDSDQRYVELELLGPLAELRPGESTSMRVRYRLIRRGDADPLREAQRILEPALRD